MPTIGALRLLGSPEPAGCSPTAGDGADEPGVAVGEDATVGRHQPVAVAVGRGRDADDGALEREVPRRAVELRGAEGEDPPSEPTSQ